MSLKFSCGRNSSQLLCSYCFNGSFEFHVHKNKQAPIQSITASVSPGLHWQLRVEHAGGNAKLLHEQLEPVAPVQRSDKHQRLALNQPQPEQRVDEQELVLLLAPDAVLLQLAAVWQLRALELQDDLKGEQ